MQRRIQTLISIAALPFIMLALGTTSVALASLVPGTYRPTTGLLPDALEHTLAYLVLGFIAAEAMAGKFKAWHIVIALVAFTGALELCQIPIPRRQCSLDDFLASASGAVAGVTLAALLRYFRRPSPTLSLR
jgi:VanZ family protein